ncbi:MAG: hypothetical protein ACRENL_01060 [Candidatus Dormibacteria bacterium]
MVPLQGPVVAATAGVLEIYEYIDVFTDVRSASQWLASTIATYRGNPTELITVTSAGWNAFSTTFGTPEPEHERAVILVGRTGAVTLTLAFQGGSSVNAATVKPLAEIAVRNMARQCPKLGDVVSSN